MQSINEINADIDAAIKDSPPENITPSSMRGILKKLSAFVNDLVLNKISPWLSVATGAPSLNADESIYRNGITEFRGGVNSIVRDSNAAMINTGFNLSGLQIQGSDTGRAAFLEFHVRGAFIHQFGVDNDGVLKFRPYATPQSFAVFINNYTQQIFLPAVITNKKISLYDGPNDHQFFGFGVNPGVLRYQVDSPSAVHAFYAGNSPTTSKELMRIQGNGRVGIGTVAAYMLDVLSAGGENGVVAQLQSSGNGIFLQLHQVGIAVWQIGQAPGADCFVIRGWGDGTYPERLRIDLSGNVGINTSMPTSRLHVKGATGHQQFRLENSYTPTGPNDPNGDRGQVAWDEDYFYWKTSVNPHRWRRAASSGW